MSGLKGYNIAFQSGCDRIGGSVLSRSCTSGVVKLSLISGSDSRWLRIQEDLGKKIKETGSIVLREDCSHVHVSGTIGTIRMMRTKKS